jgi:hypothetical protein
VLVHVAGHGIRGFAETVKDVGQLGTVENGPVVMMLKDSLDKSP